MTSRLSTVVTLVLAGLALALVQGCGAAPGEATGQSGEAVSGTCSATQAALSSSDPFEAALLALSCLDGSEWFTTRTNGTTEYVAQCPTGVTITAYCPATGLQETVDVQGLVACYASPSPYDAKSSTTQKNCGLALLGGDEWVEWSPPPAKNSWGPNCSGSRCWY